MKRMLELAGEKMKRTLLQTLVVLALFTYGPSGFAQPQPSEYDLKAAFLYQFTTFVEWPPGLLDDPDQPLVFGVVGAKELVDNLEMLSSGREGTGRSLEVRRIGTRDDLEGIHVVFVDERITNNAEPLLVDAIGKSVLTVTESDDFRPANSIINFEVVDNKVRFDVSLILAQQANLRISARMLQFALRVIGDP